MIEPIEPYCALYGVALDVPGLERQLNVPLAGKTILGQIADCGMHKGKPYPYGACNVVVPSEVSLELKVEWLADFVAKNISSFRDFGAEDIVFWIVYRGVQGNMELSVREIQIIANLNIPMAMNYYHVSPEEDEKMRNTLHVA